MPDSQPLANRQVEIGQLTDVLSLVVLHARCMEVDGAVREAITLKPCGQGARTARRFVIVTLRRWNAVELIIEASDVVTELVESAGARSRNNIDLVLVREPRGLRAEVYDGSQTGPAVTAEVRGLRRRAS